MNGVGITIFGDDCFVGIGTARKDVIAVVFDPLLGFCFRALGQSKGFGFILRWDKIFYYGLLRAISAV